MPRWDDVHSLDEQATMHDIEQAIMECTDDVGYEAAVRIAATLTNAGFRRLPTEGRVRDDMERLFRDTRDGGQIDHSQAADYLIANGYGRRINIFKTIYGN